MIALLPSPLPLKVQTAIHLFWLTHVGLVKTRHGRYDSWGIHLSNVVRFSIHERFTTAEQMGSLPNHLEIVGKFILLVSAMIIMFWAKGCSDRQKQFLILEVMISFRKIFSTWRGTVTGHCAKILTYSLYS